MAESKQRVKLYGFNNLTKSLSFNIYDVCYADSPGQRQAYIEYIDEVYNAERLTQILTGVSDIIGANILNIAREDYEPQGASVTLLISEEDGDSDDGTYVTAPASPGPLPETVLGHLDKSHITVHTYPESHPHRGVSTFRADIDVSTCGLISPLKALNYLIHSFDSDIVTMDYRVRGFTRDVEGRKHFIDHEINSIQNYLAEDTLRRYHTIDVNVFQENMFHTKMLLKDWDIDDYLFGQRSADLTPERRDEIRRQLRREMSEIFSGRNLSPDQEV
ncbi:S-adenosylmethionine decarboxylase proenzyme [wastewater metagenome]|uniref:S-adenosylmethionine decarboxylase proenzyme n=2 Tax=unclassified sequences TaxID=12908 RepID=A0A6A7SIQ4_9ZZZZ|nr:MULTISPECIES: adenosylmethionine decarboxylase [Arhodomonas]MCS4502864.1 adenosylmethionine decarboxylase [Arhodomonas aquaeolei]QEA07428.1 S-adenosylmethionine decarboxylase proenzyme [uncultured organism]QEA07715.1 S-adenosylmethionine decarboxylase proenzyme [uncultured organism]